MSSPDSSPAMAPAKRSVKELLAELSDSDDEIPRVTRKLPMRETEVVDENVEVQQSEDEDEDEVPIGRSRLAVRLHGRSESKEQEHSNVNPQPSSEQDELDGSSQRSPKQSLFQPKRRLLLKRKRSVEDAAEGASYVDETLQLNASVSPARSAVSSSSAAHQHESDLIENAGKSKFRALVEKARKERLAREEAEEAKKAARAAQQASSPTQRRQRGSSPADDSSEESDEAEITAAKRLTKDARPTRKASKKALEDMNRETQRMNRNMQLAHQVKTKKKFTKESFFAGFNRAAPVATSSSSSSRRGSDDEGAGVHSTPPTSPLHSPMKSAVEEQATVAVENAQEELEDLPDFNALFASRRAEAAEKKQRKPTAETEAVANQSKLKLDDDSEGEIEIIRDNASRRKYVVFENLPKRRAREQRSHLALRSLAKINPTKDKKSLMSGAELGPALLRRARQQALEERQAKLEKLKAKGLIIQTAEEREQEEEELEDLVEKARQEDEEIRKREKELAKKNGTYQKDIDEDDSDEDDADFEDEPEEAVSTSGDEDDDGDELEADEEEVEANALVDEAASESEQEAESEEEQLSDSVELDVAETSEAASLKTPIPSRVGRTSRIVMDDEDDEADNTQEAHDLPPLPATIRKTPQSVLRSARKVIPGLQPPSDDLPIGLTQAFAATMADSQTQDVPARLIQSNMEIDRDLPSPQLDIMPRLKRFESLDIIPESVAGSQAEPESRFFGVDDSLQIYHSPAVTTQISQTPFIPTQDISYHYSPFAGDRFAETPGKEPASTEETVLLPQPEDSPIVQRRGRLHQGRNVNEDEEDDNTAPAKSAFKMMSKAAKRQDQAEFNRKKSEARQAFDEAAEESDDEYAGLGGASDDESGEENDADRQMIDEDTQIGRGDEAKLAQLHADRERETDEAAVSKLLKDITTGALRRKRGAADDFDLSDEEDANSRRREAKRREFAKMRRELLKDEAVGKIAEDKRKEAFLRSIEDREDNADDEDDFDQPETLVDEESQSQSQVQETSGGASIVDGRIVKPAPNALQPARDSQLNVGALDHRRSTAAVSKKPQTLIEIRESVSFLIEEPDSQASMDIGLSDSEEEPEAYVNLDRHFAQAEADELADDEIENEDLEEFIVDDSEDVETADPFKKPELPSRTGDRAPFSERRTKAPVIDRLRLKRQASSSSAESTSKLAFSRAGSIGSVPSLLRRATTNSSLGSISNRDNVSGTGVVTSANKTERGSAAQEKEFVRKGANTARNAINYQGRQNLKEEKMSARAGIVKKQAAKKKSGSFLTGLFKSETWA